MVAVFFQVGRTLWGRASSLPVRVVEAGRALPRECGVLGLVGSRVPALVPGLLGRRDAVASRCPSVAPSAWSRFSFRLGGHCGGGLPACPSGLLKPAGRCRESAGYWVLRDLGFLPSSPAFWAAVTQCVPATQRRAIGAVAVFFQVGRTLWGRASSLPVRVVEAGRALPRECGVLGLAGSRVPALLPGLLGRLRRPSVAPSARSRVGGGEGCDHADGAPAACLAAGRADRIAPPGGARYDIVRGAPRSLEVDPAQCQTRHPDGAGYSAGPGRALSLSLIPAAVLPLFLPLSRPLHAAPAAVPDTVVSSRSYPPMPNAARISSAAAVALIAPSTTSRSRRSILRLISGCSRTAARTPSSTNDHIQWSA